MWYFAHFNLDLQIMPTDPGYNKLISNTLHKNVLFENTRSLWENTIKFGRQYYPTTIGTKFLWIGSCGWGWAPFDGNSVWNTPFRSNAASTHYPISNFLCLNVLCSVIVCTSDPDFEIMPAHSPVKNTTTFVKTNKDFLTMFKIIVFHLFWLN